MDANIHPEIDALREAVGQSPDNLPLRRVLAEALARHNDHAGAETEYREALKLSPVDISSLLGLARCLHYLNRNEAALEVIEGRIMCSGQYPPEAGVLCAWVKLALGSAREAIEAYLAAIELDPEAEDAELAGRLGIKSDWEKSPVVEGRIRIAEGGPFGGDDDDADEIEGQVFKEMERPVISFKDVGGMEEVKEQIRLKIIMPMAHPELFTAYGKKAGGGILMYGPPGCGKTWLARATAGETGSSFLAIGLHDVLDMWIGSSERNMRAIFEQARRLAPCVLFFDEVDALASRRRDFQTSASRYVINQFLSELDGIDASNEGVLVLAATNAPWFIDSAFRRPGRFDQVVFVPPPDAGAREAILRIHMDGKPAGAIDYVKVAAKAESFSGADLKAVVDVAIESTLQEALRRGAPIPLETKTLLKAVRTLNPSTGEWFSSARNHALYANEGGAYDDVLKYMKIKK